jgi:hypothetical protein
MQCHVSNTYHSGPANSFIIIYRIAPGCFVLVCWCQIRVFAHLGLTVSDTYSGLFWAVSLPPKGRKEVPPRTHWLNHRHVATHTEQCAEWHAIITHALQAYIKQYTHALL